MRRVILGTAGHIDHGKTTLVKALTGTDTDRLPEEKARGITIDLGFAQLELEDVNVGIVDVPGHEGLIRNMLAGATGFDAVLLVVAADEGVMPQTREHVAIARLLGVQQMVVALTKAEMVEGEWLELVRDEVIAFVSTEFGEAPVIAVSALTGDGLPQLRHELANCLSQAVKRQDEDLFRMPIDRVFTVRGTGTVVTGTVWSGRAAQHDTLHILPADRNARVRGVQTHGKQVEAACAGERAAFALAGLERQQLQRGDVLVDSDSWTATRAITARVHLLEGIQLKHRQRIRVHLGTAQVLARVVLLADRWVEMRLEQPVVARAGDRFIIRTYSPVATIGGGQVAEIDRPRKNVGDALLHLLAQLLDGAPAARVTAALAIAEEQGRSVEELPIVAGVTPAEVAAFTTSLPGDVVQFGNHLYLASVVDAAVNRVCSEVAGHHARFPLEPGIERAVLLGCFHSGLALHALAVAEKDGRLSSRGSVLAASGFRPALSDGQQALRDRLLEQLRSAGLAPPTVPELTVAHRSNDVRSILRLMETRGEVSAIHADLYVERQVLLEALAAVRARLGAGPLPAGEFKAALPVSRKYLIPLLEYLDRVGVTKRDGDLRWVVPAEHPETA